MNPIARRVARWATVEERQPRRESRGIRIAVKEIEVLLVHEEYVAVDLIGTLNRGNRYILHLEGIGPSTAGIIELRVDKQVQRNTQRKMVYLVAGNCCGARRRFRHCERFECSISGAQRARSKVPAI